MTAPIQEPLTQRSIGYGAWRSNQLERRPPPSSAGTPTVFRAFRHLTSISCAPSTLAHVSFDAWNEDDYDTSVFRPETSGGATPVMGSTLVHHIDILQEGLFIISWGVHWDVDFAGHTQMAFSDDDPDYVYRDTTIHGPPTGFGITGPYVQTIARKYLLLDLFGGGTWMPIFEFAVAQNSAATRDADLAWLDITYMAATG